MLVAKLEDENPPSKKPCERLILTIAVTASSRKTCKASLTHSHYASPPLSAAVKNVLCCQQSKMKAARIS